MRNFRIQGYPKAAHPNHTLTDTFPACPFQTHWATDKGHGTMNTATIDSTFPIRTPLTVKGVTMLGEYKYYLRRFI